MIKYNKPIHVRLTSEQLRQLNRICEETKLSHSQVFRHLLDSATYRPALIRTDAPFIVQEEQPHEYQAA